MSVINRFSRLRQNPIYTPRSVEELAVVPRAQAERDATATSIASSIDRKYDVLDVDLNMASATAQDLDREIASFTEDIGEKGVQSGDLKRLTSMKRRRDEMYSPTGVMGQAMAAKQAYSQNAADLKSMYDKGHISADKYQRGLQSALSQYQQSGGAQAGAGYSPFTAVKDSKYQEKALKLGQAFAKNPNTIANYGFKINDDGTYTEVNSKKTYKKADAIGMAIKAALSQDVEVMSDLSQQQQLGMLDANQVLTNLSNTLGAGLSYTQDGTKAKTGFVPEYMTKPKDDEVRTSDYTNIGEMDANIKTKDPRYVNRGKISRNISNIGTGMAKYYGAGSSYDPARTSKFDTSQDYIHMTDDDKYKYKHILAYQNGVDVTSVTEDMLKDPKNLSKIDEYYESLGDAVKFTPRINTGEFVRTFSNAGTKSKTRDTYKKDLTDDYTTRVFIDLESGKVTKGADLFGSSSDVKNVGIIGDVNSTNLNNSMIDIQDKNLNPKVMVSPIAVQYGNKQYYMSRSVGEMNTPIYNAETKFNEIYNKTITQPGIPAKYSTKHGEDIELIFNHKTQTYKATISSGSGMNKQTNVIELSPEQLHNEILNLELD